MKKTLLSVFGALAVGSVIGQVASPSWTTVQNAAWPQVSTGVKILSAVNANVVWATGYDGTTGNVGRNYSWFTRTINGGTSWASGNVFQSTVTPAIGDTNTFKISSMEGVDANTCWVSSYLKATDNKGAIHKTTNGGTSWQNMTATGMFTNTSSFCNIVTFVTPSVGITMGDPNGTGNEFEIWRTTDAGATWSLIPGSSIPNPVNTSEYGLTGVYTKFGTTNIWYGTNEGRIYRSTDAGLTWNVSTLNATSVGINKIAFTTASNGYAWLANASQALETYTTNDGGATWAMIPTVDPNLGQNDMCAIPGTPNYASCGAGSTNTIISYSQNNAVNWIDWGSTGIQYLQIDFVNNTTGWAGGFSDPTTAGVGGIYKYSGPAITNISLSVSIPSIVCLAGPTASAAISNSTTGTPTPTYTWTSSPAAVFSSSTATSPTVTFAAAGNYTITLTAQNSTGTNTLSQVVTVQACSAPTASFSVPTGTLCNKVAYTFTNNTTGSPTPTYTWSVLPVANVTINPSSSATSPTISFGTANVYSVTLLASNAGGTATVTHTVQIANCTPVASFTIPSTVTTCTGTPFTPTVNVTGNAPISYAWSVSPLGGVSFSPNAFTVTPSIQGLSAGAYTITLKATNTSGSVTAAQTITITACTVGIHENANSLASISVFPNPSNGIFNLANTLNDNINYTVTNILGSVVSSGKFNTAKNIDLSGQSKGIYFIIFENNGSKLSKKIIIE